MDSQDTSPFTPVCIKHIQGVQLTACVQVLLLIMPLPLESQRGACNYYISLCRLSLLQLSKEHRTRQAIDVLSPKQPPWSVFMTCFTVMFWSRTHQSVLAFTLQKLRGQICLRPHRWSFTLFNHMTQVQQNKLCDKQQVNIEINLSQCYCFIPFMYLTDLRMVTGVV